MVLYISEAFKISVKTAPFVIARIIANAYFVLFSVLIAVFAVLTPVFFNLTSPLTEVFLVIGIIVFFVYWIFFRKRILYVLRSSEAVVISELISGRNIPVSTQASFGFNLIKKKFSSTNNFREFETKTTNVMKKIYGVIGFIGFIPNVNSSITSSVLSYVFADSKVDSYTSLRDALILFYQKKTFILFQVFAMQMFSYITFFLSYLVLFFIFNPFIQLFVYPFTLIFYIMIFLLLLLIYSSFVSHFLISWQNVFFIETIKNDSPLKNTRSVLENLSEDFNEISSKAKLFVPLQSISSRNLLSSFEEKEEKKKSSIFSLNSMIKDKHAVENEAKGKEALTELVSKITEIKTAPKKAELKKKMKKEKQRLSEKYKKEKEYNRIFNLLLEFLGDQLGVKNKIEITSLEKKDDLWVAVVFINKEPFDFKLNTKGKVIDFKEKE